jgi:type IV pilus assembly protein PilC
MPNYSYIARDIKTGESVKSSMLANSELDLANKLRANGYILIKAEEEKGKIDSKSGKLKPKELLTFTLHLSAFLNAGIPILEALDDLSTASGSERASSVISDIYRRVKGGSSLSDALSAYPKSFPKIYTALVKSGEGTGNLDSALVNIASYLEWQMGLRAKVKEAATYPIILTCGMIGVVAILVGKVVPTFKPLFEGAGVALPLPTQIVLGVSDIFRKFWYLALIGIVGFFLFFKFYSKTEKGRYLIDSLKLKLPLFGVLIRKVCLSRFAHTLSLSINSGVTLLEALRTSSEVIGNVKISKAVDKAEESVNMGEELATALERSNEFPTLVIKMIKVGEKSGSLVESLNKVSQFYDREVPSVINKIFALMEPIMIVVIGVVVGGIALSIFLPLFRLAQTIGG